MQQAYGRYCLWFRRPQLCKPNTLRWRHNGRDSVSNHQPYDCLLNHLFRRRSKKTSKFRITGLCAGNSPGTGEMPARMASNAENVSIWWRHHETDWIQPSRNKQHIKVWIFHYLFSCVTDISPYTSLQWNVRRDNSAAHQHKLSIVSRTSPQNASPRHGIVIWADNIYAMTVLHHCIWSSKTIQWCHNDHDCSSNHRPRDCLLNRLFRRRSKKREISASMALWGEFNGDRWIPRTEGQ